MNPFFIFLILATLGALIFWFRQASRAQGILALKGALIALALLLIVAIATGRVPILAAIPLLAMALFRKFALSYLLIPLIKILAGRALGRATSRSTPEGDMSAEQARNILGLEEGASREQVIEAHRRTMQKVHPDRGGSDYLAQQANLARDTLIELLKKP